MQPLPANPPPSLIRRLLGLLWYLLLVAVIGLALYVGAGRMVLANADALRAPLLALLNDRLPFTLEVEQLSGRMRGLDVAVSFRGLRLSGATPGATPLRVSSGELYLAPLRSLLSGTPRARVLRLRGMDLALRQDASGRFSLEGLAVGSTDVELLLRDLLNSLDDLYLQQVNLQRLDPLGTSQRGGLELSLLRVGESRTLDASLTLAADSQLTLHAEGVGNPLDTSSWRGDVYARVRSAEVGVVLDWLPAALPVSARGELSAEGWLLREAGRSDLALRLDGGPITLVDGEASWRLPLSSLSMNANLAQTGTGWRLHASELLLEQAGRQWQLPRAQFELEGDVLDVRTGALQFDGVEALIGSLPGTPPGLAEALSTLRPRGYLQSLQLRLDDIHAPASGWSFSALVERAALDSWRGAPAVRGATAFVSLGPGGGSVTVDSRDLELALPRVYQNPLRYTDVLGRLALRWDEGGVFLRSGLLSAIGEEGTTRALLALRLPRDRALHPVGPEMDLLVGLRDSSVEYRAKYLPFTLPDSLQRWLNRSVVDGHVAAGGFVWRGSLRPRNFQHLSVQLYFDLSDTELLFDPAWPPLEQFSGQVLVSDRDVSVWGSTASIAGNQLAQLTAESWADGQGVQWLELGLRGSGEAGAALELVNASPLSTLSRGALSDWQAVGTHESRLELQLPLLSGSRPTRIALSTTLDNARLAIEPGALVIENVQGALRYQQDRGFSGSALNGTLWGEALSLAVKDAPLGGAHTIELGGRVRPAALSQWLALPLDQLARGSAAVSGQLVLSPDAAPRLELNSDLLGVGLQLPEPWGKNAALSSPLSVVSTLGAEQTTVDLSLDRALSLQVLLAGGELRDGVLQFESPWLQGSLHIGGQRLLLVDWLDIHALGERLRGLSPATSTERRVSARWFDRLAALPAMDVHVLELRREGSPIGELAFHFDSDPQAIYADALRGQLLGLRTIEEDEGGVLRWARVVPAQTGRAGSEQASGAGAGESSSTVAGNAADAAWSSSLSLALGFADLGQSLDDLGYPRSLETAQGRARVNFSWPGAPTDFSLSSLQGSLQLSARNGRLLTVDTGSTDALKMVSLLNLTEILQGLSLANVFDTGVPFERGDVSVLFEQGRLLIPRLRLDSAMSAFAFSGTTDLDTVAGELVVTLPVASNLPWVAALAGGLPAAAGVFVVSKVFEKQVNRMASGVYTVSGALREPDLRLSRIFDDSASSVQSAGGGSAQEAVKPPSDPASGNGNVRR